MYSKMERRSTHIPHVPAMWNIYDTENNLIIELVFIKV